MTAEPVSEKPKPETSTTVHEGVVTDKPAGEKPESEPKQEDLDLSDGAGPKTS